MRLNVWQIIEENMFYLFKKQNRLRYNEKTKTWNKEFSPIIKSIKIDKGHATSYENYIAGYTLGQWIGNKCLYCGKFLSNPRSKFCEEQHRVEFNRIKNIGKSKYGFELGKNNHRILIPTLYESYTDKNGHWFQKRNKTKRIERKNIEFVINGKRNPLTTKSRSL